MPAPCVPYMAALHGTPTDATHIRLHHRPRRVCCFSFAAYAKTVIDQLWASGVPVAEGLSDAEFSDIESSHGFDFPSDLRAILQEGLPVGAGFPNWRSSSPEQLRSLLRRPAFGLLHEVARGRFWCEAAWGSKPNSPAEAVGVAKSVMDAAPPLAPIYGHFYMPSRPNLAGNPVFFVRRGEVRCSGFDLTDFFRRQEFKGGGSGPTPPLAPAPAWAATSARQIDLWTHLVEAGGSPRQSLQKLLEELEWKLREGGWTEGEVREMLTAREDGGQGDRAGLLDRHSVGRRVRLLAEGLLRAGWSDEDVAYCMGESGGGGGGQLKGVMWRPDQSNKKKNVSMEL